MTRLGLAIASFLRAMVDNGRLDAKDVAGIEIAKIKKREDVNQGAYYADWIAQTANAPQRPITMPLKVHTSYIPKLQRVAEQAVESVLKASSKGRRVGQAALVAMRPDGRVVAIVGGRDYDKSQFNRAVQALRQPGSAFKTIVYLAALREGAHASMMVEDEPIAVGDWIPKNYGLSHRGLVSLQQAFASSINTVAVRVSEATGRNNVIGDCSRFRNFDAVDTNAKHCAWRLRGELARADSRLRCDSRQCLSGYPLGCGRAG